MGAWGVLAFDNDNACDWAHGLDDADDLSLVESAFATFDGTDGTSETSDACNALAACEVLARLNGKPGYENAYTEDVDLWVAAHPSKPSAALLARADAVIDRILGENSELQKLWSDSDESNQWVASVEDLRDRMRA